MGSSALNNHNRMYYLNIKRLHAKPPKTMSFCKGSGKMLNYLPGHSTMQNASVGTGTRCTPAGRIKNRRILICIYEVVLTYINTAYLVQVL